jgi:hypothetical protein
MKKICMIVFGMMFACGAYATTDIAANAESGSCTEPTLGKYEGSADLEAKWNANTVPLRWYNNNTVIQNATNTCNYDGGLTLPSDPQRTGYTFDGWKVRPMMEFSTLTSLQTANDSQRWGKGYVLSSGADYCYYDVGTSGYTVVNCKTNSGFNALSQKEWKVQYNSGTTKGTLYGSAYCSAKSGSHNSGAWNVAESFATTAQLEAGTTANNAQYCWCQATGWQPENSSTIYGNSGEISWGNQSVSSSAAWVFRNDAYSSADACAQACAASCAGTALYNSAFRRALFVGTGN